MTALGQLAQATLGTITVADGFSLAPTNPTSMTCTLSPGQVYQVSSLEATGVSSLPANLTQIVKQGVLLNSSPVTFAPQLSVGQSCCYLVQVQYLDADTGDATLNFYNAGNPAVPVSGVDGNGAKSKTVRAGTVGVAIKPGTPTTGIPAAPAPDVGYIGLFVVTIAYGQSTILAGQIATYAGAPLIPEKLPQIPTGIQTQKYTYVRDVGAVNALQVNPVPALTQIPEGTELFIKPLYTSTTTVPTLTVNGQTAVIVKRDATALVAGDIKANVRIRVFYDGTQWRVAGPANSDLSATNSTPDLTTAITSNRIPSNFARRTTNIRTVMSGSGAYNPLAMSIPTYTKIGSAAATNLLVIAEPSGYVPTAGGAGPVSQTLTDGNGHSDTKGLSMTFNLSGTGAIGITNTGVFILQNVPPGPVNLSLYWTRGDATAWNAIANPDNADFNGGSHTGTGATSFFTFMEVPV